VNVPPKKETWTELRINNSELPGSGVRNRFVSSQATDPDSRITAEKRGICFNVPLEHPDKMFMRQLKIMYHLLSVKISIR
jgi:hypothetical protein